MNLNNASLFSNKIHLLLITGIFLFTLNGCQNEDQQSKSSQGLIKLSIEVVNPESSNNKSKSAEENITVQDDKMFFEVSQSNHFQTYQKSTSTLGAGIKFRLIAFKNGAISSENYVGHTDYTMNADGTASSSQNIILNAGNNYVFVAYSLGNSADLPSFNATNLTVETDPSQNHDLLYWKQTNVTIVDGYNNLSIVFKHMFALATVVIDVSQMAINVSELEAQLPNTYKATLNLADSTLVQGAKTATPIPWINTSTSGFANPKWTLTSKQFAIYQGSIGDSTKVSVTTMKEGTTSYAPSHIIPMGATLTRNTTNTLTIYPKKFMDLNEFVPVLVTTASGDVYFAQGNLINIAGAYGFNYRPEAYTGRWKGGDYWNDFASVSIAIAVRRRAGDLGSPSDPDPCVNVPMWNGMSWRLPTASEDDAFEMSFFTINSSYSDWTTRNGNQGRYFGTTSIPPETDKATLFMPASGYRDTDSLTMRNVHIEGNYWTSGVKTLTPDQFNNHYLHLSSSSVNLPYTLLTDRFGYAIRCVAYPGVIK